MVLIITQETFNQAVQENIQDLGLEPDEAVREAVVQFESQGVDLSSIIKELMLEPKPEEAIEDNIKLLNDLIKSKAPSEKVIEQLEILKTECDKGIQYRVAVGRHGAYPLLLDVLVNYNQDIDVRKNCIRTLTTLMTKQPDLLDDRGIEIIIAQLDQKEDTDIKRLTLKWTKECCIMHEKNRQNIFNAKIIEQLKKILQEAPPDLVKEAMGVCRALVLDDDVRVEFGKAHEHARVIASECLCILTSLLSRLKHDEQFICDLMQTLSVLLVRTEFCKKVVDAGCLELMRDIMSTFPNSQVSGLRGTPCTGRKVFTFGWQYDELEKNKMIISKVNRQCFKLLKGLAGDDECKSLIIKNELAPVIAAALLENKANVQTSVAGLACIAAISLRNPDNSTALFKANAPQAIVEVMKMHPNEKQVQKTASWAIRNMVSRSKYQCQTFLGLRVEELLQKNMKKFKEIEYDIKAALRDLGCKVQLNEEWTGKGGALTTGAVSRQ